MGRWLKRFELRLKNSPFYAYRRGAKRVFYPGCSLPGADPEFCLQVYHDLKKKDPELGIWFDCCSKPQRLGRDLRSAEKNEQSLLEKLKASGVEEVIVACGNCYTQFASFGAGALRVRFLYDMLETPEQEGKSTGWIMHHPCFARQFPELQESSLRLTDQLGIRLSNRQEKRHPLPCCLRRGDKYRQRVQSLQGQKLITYCAHCVMQFQADLPTRHLLQELYGNSASWTPPGKKGLFANYRKFCKLLIAGERDTVEGSDESS